MRGPDSPAREGVEYDIAAIWGNGSRSSGGLRDNASVLGRLDGGLNGAFFRRFVLASEQNQHRCRDCHCRDRPRQPCELRRSGNRFELLRAQVLQRPFQIGCRLPAIVWIFRQTTSQHRVHRPHYLRFPSWLGVHDRCDDACRRLARKRPLARQHLVEHCAEGENVAARVGIFAFELLRRHIGKRAQHSSFFRYRQCLRSVGVTAAWLAEFRQAEIEEFDT